MLNFKHDAKFSAKKLEMNVESFAGFLAAAPFSLLFILHYLHLFVGTILATYKVKSK